MKNKMIYVLSLFLFLKILPVAAQDKVSSLSTDHLTLEGAIDFALNNSPILTAQKLRQENDVQELSRIQRSKMPDIYISGDIRRNLIIPSTPIPASMINTGADPNQILYMKFNTDWNSGAGINLSYDIFNPVTFRQASEQKIQNRISSYDTRISETDVRAGIAQAYAACVIAQDQLESLKSDTAFNHSSLMEATNLFRLEKISVTDKNNAVMAYNISIMQFHNAERVLQAAGANLLYLMGTEVTVENIAALHLSEDIPTLYAKLNPGSSGSKISNQSIDSIATGYGLARQSEVIVLAQSRIKSAHARYAPSLSLGGFYGTNYYGNSFNPGDGSLWHGNSYLALSLKIPLTQSFTTSKEVARLKLQKQIEQENLRDMQNRNSKERLDAENLLSVSQKEYEIYRQNYELSTANLNASRAQIDKGYIQDKDYLSEQVKCRNAYQNFLQAAYNVFINAINLQKLEEE